VEICFHRADAKVATGKAGVVTYWRVENFSAALARAIEMGGVLHRGPLAIENNDTMGQVLDPFGNLFGLVGPI
jgi:predicted enzyme related to lactoylglutathione lyase